MKIFFRFIRITGLTIIVIYIGLFTYYQFGWKNHYSENQVQNLLSKIENTPRINDTFYIMYDFITNNRHQIITNLYLKNFWTEFGVIGPSERENWQYIAAYMEKYKGQRYKIAPMTLAFKINKSIRPEKCFDYVMTHRFNEYSKEFKLNNSIQNLGKSENILHFIIANERPSFYRRHPTKHRQEIDSLLSLIKNKAANN